MSDAVADDGEYQDDTITLNGVKLAVNSPIRAGMVSEFSTGMKVGKATYDERLHAFWIALDDFSGGFGFRQLDVREAGGTHFDNVGGVDLRRPRHITLPARRDTLDPPSDPALSTLISWQDSMIYSDISGAERLYVAILEDIFYLDIERSVLTRVYDGSADPDGANAPRFGRIIEGVASDGTRFLLATGVDATGSEEYVRTEDGGTWVKSSGIPATPAANASMQLSDAIWWNGLVIAHGEGDQIIGSSDGKAWDVDEAGLLDPRWRTGGSFVRFVGTAMAPWGYDAPYFLSKGHLWILDWYLYNAVKVEDLGDRNVLRAGVVWNGSIIVTDGWNIWEYNPGNAQTVRRIGLFGKDGPPPSTRSDTGHPGQADNYYITHFIPGTSDLFAICRSLTGAGAAVGAPSWRLAVYNGVGWSWFGSEVTSSQAYAGIMGIFPSALSLQLPTRTIDVVAIADQNSTDWNLHTIHLPPVGDIPVPGPGQRFEDGPLSFETGWFDGGFAELEGALLQLSFDGYSMSDTETVLVEYRLNNQTEATYETLGTFKKNSQKIWFSDDHRGVPFMSVQFRISLDRGIGVKFSDAGTNVSDAAFDAGDVSVTVQDSSLFRIGDVVRFDEEQCLITAITAASELLTITRGYNSTTDAGHSNGIDVYAEEGVSPEIKALILVYDKVPKMRTAWTIRIDVSRMIERPFSIDEETATTESIWQFLKSLVNTPTLTKMVVPSMESGGVNVRITDMPATISDFRTAMGGRGFIELQLIETVGE
ncbi:hypothetical protein LCGC14_0289160 [marine sediment metagenome]|uniref:Uncharacterized protein n=1 Tax=marine sediment metagenome TaxID=412755 RepID=A0A0F9TYR9_9ZZZZ